MAFEKRVLRELGESLPGLRERLNAVAEGMIDLMEPFKRRDIYHWRMVGEISDPAELARLRKALLEYCRQDTLGLFRLLEKMRSMEAWVGELNGP
ncbi:MAG: hypothetical protein XU12_C0010G0026 [Deltaproteobacteria bacterium CSP1-8]|nr:MAG: hypothetical protein XU12_C0010G0026 [Deltaproteobacteria bacterium CSP1-8]